MKILLFMLISLAVLIINCAEDGNLLEESSDNASASVSIIINKVGTLGNNRDIKYEYLLLSLSSIYDTIFDTIQISGNGQKKVNRVFQNLIVPINWTLCAETRDINNRIIHSGSTEFQTIYNDTVDVSLILDAIYSMIKFGFNSIPDSVLSVTAIIDDSITIDSHFITHGEFDTVILGYDYLTVDTSGVEHTISLIIRGRYWGIDTILYKGDTTISAFSGMNNDFLVFLKWVGPNIAPVGTAPITIIIGNVGSININTEFENNPVTLSSNDHLVYISDSTIISANVNSPNSSNLTYIWSTNIGEIKGNGTIVNYCAPIEPCSAKISLKVFENNDIIGKDSIVIRIYKQLIILKADDLMFDNTSIIPPGWQWYIEYIRSKKIKTSIGLICNSLEKGNVEYVETVKNIAEDSLIEIWNHGFDHWISPPNYEFKNTPYSHQKAHFEAAQQIAKEKLGIILHTFGAPGNGIDTVTKVVVSENEDIDIWLYGYDLPNKTTIYFHCAMEFGPGNPNYSQFLANYNNHKHRKYLCLQHHPMPWGEGNIEFEQIIDFLISEKVVFITPYDFFNISKKIKK